MDENVIELTLSSAVHVTTADDVRATIGARLDAKGLDRPEVELVRFHVLLACTSGHGRHMVDFEEHDLEPGTALWIRPGQVQRWNDVHDGFAAHVLVFESSIIPDLGLFDDFIGTTSAVALREDAERFHQQMDWLNADLEASNDHATAAAVVGVMLRVFARQRHRGSAPEPPGHELATAFLDSVDRNIEQRSVAWHARNVGASTRSVARATGAALGRQPKEVIDARVILEAQRRLAWSTEDVATIARALRFSEASNFTKYFRTRTGTSPSAFRAQHAAFAADHA